MNVGSKIKEIRKRCGLSQEELAEGAKINRTYLSQLENSRSSPTVAVLMRIANALEVDAVDLISEAPSAREPGPYYESDLEGATHPGLQAFLDDERTRLLMNPNDEEIQLLKGIRFIDSFKPSKQFFVEVLLEMRRSKGD
ncbi:helix-turn-helix domain-containing protein [bacterium]|nr:helix-turn-helix domain-containing protein [bacterium]MBU1652418.1 helix-turn-helix domain-containing protein [bacterium]MBU1881425.1 helix-turn-helix domain-containing protein [bacterium]